MNRNQKDALVRNLVVENSNEVRSIPNFAGDVLVFDASQDNFIEEVPETDNINAWTRINATNGAISATQLLRRGNGLQIEGNNSTERLQNLVSNYTEGNETIFTIFIRSIRERGTGENTRRYLMLDVQAGEHSAEDFA